MLYVFSFLNLSPLTVGYTLIYRHIVFLTSYLFSECFIDFNLYFLEDIHIYWNKIKKSPNR